LEVVKYLVSIGADVHACDDLALRGASNNGHLEVVKYLVSIGADVHACDDYALRWASLNGQLDVVEYLKNINDQQSKAAPSNSPATHIDIIQALVEKTSNPEQTYLDIIKELACRYQ